MPTLHPAFDPDVQQPEQSCPLSSEQYILLHAEEQLAIEFKILQAMQANNQQLDAFIDLLQQVRDAQVQMEQRMTQLLEILGGGREE